MLLLLCMLFLNFMVLNIFNFIQRTKQVPIELDISAIEDYILAINSKYKKIIWFLFVPTSIFVAIFERLWRHSKEEADLLAYRQQCRSVSMQLTKSKRDYYSTKIEASNNY